MTDETAVSGINITPPRSLSGKTVLVTGGAGLVGRRLVAVLAPVADVRVVDHFQTSDPAELPDSVTIYQGDICDRLLLEHAVSGVDIVFHQAATSGPYTLDNLQRSHAVNSTATLQLLEATRERDVRTVLASSAAVYGSTEPIPINETAQKTPLEPYGVQKLSTDLYGQLYRELHNHSTVVLRYFNVYGYRPERSQRKNVVNIFIEQARSESDLEIKGSGQQRRDFIHVDDVVRANLSAATTEDIDPVFNIGTGKGTTIARLAELVQGQAGDIEVTHTEKRRTDVEDSVADITKARHQLGYEPTVGIEDGITKLWSEYRRRKDGPE